MRKYLFARLKEPSTWRGLALLLSVFGAQLSEAQVNSFIELGLFVSGMIGVFAPEPVLSGAEVAEGK